MTGEMHQSEVTAENFPLHFAAAKEFNGEVHPFDQYQGPYITIADRFGGGPERRFFLSTDDGVFCCWWDESTGEFSPGFVVSDEIIFAVHSFRDLIENGGSAEPDYKAGLVIDADGTLAMLHSLSSYVSADDVGKPREQFLRMVADRIMDDLPTKPAPGISAEGAADLLALAKRMESPHDNMIYVGRDLTKRDVIAEICRIVSAG
jgi:hypothetical protein